MTDKTDTTASKASDFAFLPDATIELPAGIQPVLILPPLEVYNETELEVVRRHRSTSVHARMTAEGDTVRYYVRNLANSRDVASCASLDAIAEALPLVSLVIMR